MPRSGAYLLSPPQVEEIVRRYGAGEPTEALARAFTVSAWAIRSAMDREGVPRRTLSEAHRRYRCDDHFFDVIDTEAKAYWLGFLAADGCVFTDSHGRLVVRVELARRDAEHLQRLCGALRAEQPVHRSRGGRAALLHLSSERLAQALVSHGIVPRKSLVLRWPSTVPEPLLPHYLRGHADGDGHFGGAGRKHGRIRFAMAGSWPFLAGLGRYLHQTLGLLPSHTQDRGQYGTAHYGGRLRVAAIWHLLYDHATVWLPRKREAVSGWIVPFGDTKLARIPRPRSELRYAQGEGHPQARLLREDVLAMRDLYAAGGWTHAALGQRFGVTGDYAGKVIRRERWAHLRDP